MPSEHNPIINTMIENLPIEIQSDSLFPEDLQDLQNAVVLLTNPSLTTKLTSIVGSTIEYLMDKMPKDASDKIQKVIETSLHKVFDVSANTMQNEKKETSNKWHKFGARLSRAVGGFFGQKPNWNAFPYSGSQPTKTNRTTVRKADTTPAVSPLIKS